MVVLVAAVTALCCGVRGGSRTQATSIAINSEFISVIIAIVGRAIISVFFVCVTISVEVYTIANFLGWFAINAYVWHTVSAFLDFPHTLAFTADYSVTRVDCLEGTT